MYIPDNTIYIQYMHSRFTILNIYNKYIPGIHYKASRALLAHPRFSRGLIHFLLIFLLFVIFCPSINQPWGYIRSLKNGPGRLLNPFYPDVQFHDWFPGGGGVKLIPPYFLIVIQIYTIWYVLGKPLGSTSIICKKNGNFAKIQIFIAKIATDYTFLKSPCPSDFKYAKTFAKYFKPKSANSLERRLCKNVCYIFFLNWLLLLETFQSAIKC